MHFEDLDVPVGSKACGRLLDKIANKIDAERGVGGLDDRNLLCGLCNRLMMSRPETRRAHQDRDCRGEGAIEAVLQRIRRREIDENVTMFLVDDEPIGLRHRLCDCLAHAPAGREKADADRLVGGAHRLLLAKPLLQGQRCSRSANFGAVDHENIGVSPGLLPGVRPGRKDIERCLVIPSWNALAHALQPCIGKVCSIRVDRRIFVRILKDDRDVAGAAKLEERFVTKALVTGFYRVAERQPVELLGKTVDESRRYRPGRTSGAERIATRSGPSLGPSAVNPCARKPEIPSAASASFDRITQ